ncbi:MAG: hypothetical protein P4L35_15200 [Ignavibacteriaceae bacterium]|nr:hypothetical protein [Ignavibacteriaceae bacterium]
MHSELYGNKVMKEDIIREIQSINFQGALISTSKLSALLYAVLQEAPDALNTYDLIKTVYGLRVIENNGNIMLYCSRVLIFSIQTLFTLNKWLLAYGTDDLNITKVLSPIDELYNILKLAIMINDYLPIDVDVDGHEVEFMYLMAYHNTIKNIKNQIARSYYLFVTLMNDTAETKDFSQKFFEINQFRIEEYLAECINNLQFVYGEWKIGTFFTLPVGCGIKEFDAKLLTPVHEKIINTLAEPPEMSKKKAVTTIDRKWDFDLFYMSPMIAINNLALSISPITTLYQAFEGLYWKLFFLTNDNEHKIAFSRGFGRVFEHYIQQVSYAATGNGYDFLNEFVYQYKGDERRASDAYIKQGTKLIIIEAKAKSPQGATLKGYSRNIIEEELVDLLVAPVHQVDQRLCEILSEDSIFDNQSTKDFFTHITQVSILTVSMEKVQPVNVLSTMADAYLHSEVLAPVVKLVHGKKVIEPTRCKLSSDLIKNYFNFNLDDFEAICLLIENGIDVFSLLEELFSLRKGSQYEVPLFRNLVIKCGNTYGSSKFVNQILDKTFKQLYQVTFGKSMEG